MNKKKMNKKMFTTVFIANMVCLFIFFLQSMAYADNPGANHRTLEKQSSTTLILDTQLSSKQQKGHVNTAKNSASSTKKPKPGLTPSKKTDPIAPEFTGDFLNIADENEDLRIATSVQATEKKEKWLIGSHHTGDNIETGEEYLEPYAGEFTPNTEEENNIVLASLLIIFTGAVIIAILSYL